MGRDLRWKKVRSLDGMKTQKDVDDQDTQVKFWRKPIKFSM
jgi:hypothetical protein